MTKEELKLKIIDDLCLGEFFCEYDSETFPRLQRLAELENLEQEIPEEDQYWLIETILSNYEYTSLSELLTNINYLANTILKFIDKNYEDIQNYKTK